MRGMHSIASKTKETVDIGLESALTDAWKSKSVDHTYCSLSVSGILSSTRCVPQSVQEGGMRGKERDKLMLL